MSPELQTEILIEHIYKSFNGNDVLQGISLKINSGEIVAIVGGSGCGKTVLMNLILGQFTQDKGKILVNDHAVNNARLRDLTEFNEFEIDNIHRHWGVVFQRNALFSGSVYENIALWLREVKGMDDEGIMPIAEETLRAVGLPDDTDFLTSDHGNLSGGMAKRLAVARALSMDPSVIFYDEPTTGLDPVNSAQIHDLILDRHHQNLSDGGIRTSIIITHDKDLLNRSRPRTIMLHSGKVYFDGSFDEFENSESDIIRPYFDLMPILDQRYLVETPRIPDLSRRKGLII